MESVGVDKAVPLEGIMPSAATLGEMQGFMVQALPVNNNAERAKIDKEWMKYYEAGSGVNDLNFDWFALDWNKGIEQIEKGGNQVVPMSRETAGQLKTYWAV